MTEERLFDAYVEKYDGHRRDIIPGFERFYGRMIGRIPFDESESFRMLDLGAGTGLSTELVQSRFERVQVTLLDESPEMLGRARERFEGNDYRYRVGDALSVPFEEDQFDVVFSALVLHYFVDEAKRRLIDQVLNSLTEAGVFVVGTVVAAPTESLQEEYQSAWIEEARQNGTPEDVIEEARERQSSHHLASVDDHLKWLRQAGFRDVDCWYKDYGLAVVGGRKPSS